ncbi:hypothetical protein J5Y03_16470 [Bacillus sp. RG28]|uniref:Uncharacterized protein n=1 Tax=Gottfriedia endophytica TaxID=2820819 RepID=A0A940SL59_9BACI|nr:Imm6 family immunity protein [Gottfriedia endophytica]MBP0726754.1 hypothetical protein [Gottfriedia endophytica]
MGEKSFKELVWGCIVDAISFTNWRAYQFDNEEYLPAPIENVEESILQQFLDGFYEIKLLNKKGGYFNWKLY